jgi:hypothetical protein
MESVGDFEMATASEISGNSSKFPLFHERGKGKDYDVIYWRR